MNDILLVEINLNRNLFVEIILNDVQIFAN